LKDDLVLVVAKTRLINHSACLYAVTHARGSPTAVGCPAAPCAGTSGLSWPPDRPALQFFPKEVLQAVEWTGW